MGKETLYITDTCFIRNQSIHARSGFRLSKKTESLEDFLMLVYESLQINYPKFFKMDRLSKLGLLAAEVLLMDVKLLEKYPPESVGLVLSNASGSLDTDIRYYESTKTIPSPSLFVYTLPNIVAGEICIRHGIKGENTFLVSEKFDPALMAGYVDRMMAGPETQICMAGWIEVLDEHHDVFLYLVQKTKGELSLPHSKEQLTGLYHEDLWNN